MGTEKDTAFDKIQKTLFEDDAAKLECLNPKENEMRKRIQAAFTIWIDNPQYTDRQLVKFLQEQFSISEPTAYTDIRMTKIMLGNVNKANKNWVRHQIYDTQMKVIQIAMVQVQKCKESENNKLVALVPQLLNNISKSNEVISKAHQLDKEDVEAIDWSKVAILQLDITTDPSVLEGWNIGLNRDEKIKLLRQYSVKDVQDAEIVS